MPKAYAAYYKYDYAGKTVIGIFNSRFLAEDALKELGYKRLDRTTWSRGLADFGDEAGVDMYEMNKIDQTVT